MRTDEQACKMSPNREPYLLGEPVPGSEYTTAYILSGLAAERYKPDFATDAAVRFLKGRQANDGRWRNRTPGRRSNPATLR